MRLLLCSVFPSRFHRHGNQKNQTDSKKQVQDSCATQSVAAIANPTSQDCKDTTQISDNNDNISQLPSPPRPASTKQIHIPISRSGAQSPPRLPTDSAHRDSSIASLPVQLWDRAYNDFKREEMELVDSYEKILSRQLQEGLGSKVPKSQLNIIAQDEPDRRRHQMIQLIHSGLDKTESEAKLKDNLKVPVDVIFSAKNIISSAIQAVPQAALAWSGICVALEVLANPINQTEANRKGIDYVIKRMDWYWSLSNSVFRDLPDHDTDLSGIRRQLEDRLVDLYKALLSYQIKSVYSYFQNRGLIFFQDMIKLDDWDAELEAVQEAEKSFQDDTHAFSTQQMLSHSNQIVTQGRNQEIRQASKEDQQCLQHLRLTNPRDDKSRIERTKGGLLQDSYRWVLDNHDFQQWRDHKESQLLWIKGDPGKGKTMLLSGIINELDQGNTANVRNSNVAYFFCQATDSRINSATAVLRGLIYMLADQQPSLLSHVRNEYERAGESLFSDRNTWDVLLTIFTNVQQDTSLKMTYLIIDALDECVTDRPQLLDLIAKRSSNSSRVKWIVSSRNWPEIKEQFGMATQKATLSLELNAESVAEAVNAYIRHKVSQLSNRKKYNNKTRTAIQEYLSSNAKDTFLWVALVCKALEDPSLRNWQSLKMLETFPAGLDSLYGLMMQRIKNLREADLCRNILAVIATVRRPISLEEITSIVEMPDGLCDESEDLEEIISLCGSFLTLQNKTIYFVHQSAKDFLLGKASNNRHSQEAFNWVFHSGIEEVNYSILLKSLQAMSTTLQRDMYHLSVPGFMIDQVPKQDPDPLVTVRYSCVYWIHHLCDLISTTSSKRDVLQEHGIIHTFFKTKYLYWLEALSLFGAMSNGIKVMKQLQSQLENNTHEHLTAIIRDGYRFVMSYGRIIEQAPLQAYTSALVFAPTHSLVKENFKQEEPKWLSNQPVVEAQWNACLQTLEGHGGWVLSVVFSPDGKQVASGSDDKTVKIWDAGSGSCVQTLESHGCSVLSVVFSPDGKQVASGSYDKTVKIWDAGSGSCVQTLEGHGGSVLSVVFSPDGKQVASGSDDKTVKIWDAGSGSCLQTFEGHGGWVRSVVFSPDGKQVASGSYDKTVKIWDAGSGSCVQTLEGHGGWVRSVVFSSDGRQVASGSDDKTVKIWDAGSGSCVQTLEGHGGWVRSVVFSPDGKQVASGSDDKIVKIWDAGSGSCVQTLEGHGGSVRSVVFSPGGKQIASGSDDKTVKIWDAGSGSCVQTLEGHGGSVRSVVFSPDGKQVASGSYDKTVKIWDAGSGSCVQTLEGHGGSVLSVVFSPDGKQVASGSYDKTVKIWDAGFGSCVQTLEGQGGWVLSVAFSPDGKQVASGSYDKTVKIWDAGSGSCVQTLEGHGASVWSVAFSPDGKQVASGSYDKTVKIWDAGSGNCVQTLEGHGDWVTSDVFSPERAHLNSTAENPNQLDNPKRYLYGLGKDGSWITCNGQGVLWLPQEYRPTTIAIQNNIMAFSSQTGRVFIISFVQKG